MLLTNYDFDELLVPWLRLSPIKQQKRFPFNLILISYAEVLLSSFSRFFVISFLTMDLQSHGWLHELTGGFTKKFSSEALTKFFLHIHFFLYLDLVSHFLSLQAVTKPRSTTIVKPVN